CPSHRTEPCSGDNKLEKIRSKLVFPLPFSPTTANSDPRSTFTLRSVNNRRSPRLQRNETACNIRHSTPVRDESKGTERGKTRGEWQVSRLLQPSCSGDDPTVN